MCFAPQQRPLYRHLNFQKWSEHVMFYTCWLENLLRATTASTFSTSQLPNVVRTCLFLNILTWKCASRHNSVHFFDIWTSKSGPNMWCLHILTWKCASRYIGVHFFDISTSKSGPNMTFFFNILTWRCASRHNSVNFFDIWTSKSSPNVRCF